MQFLIFISNPVGISIFFWLGGSLWGKSKRSPSFPPISHTHPPFLSLPLSSFWQSHTHKPIGRNHKISHHTRTIYISPSSLCKRACTCVCVRAPECVGQTSEIDSEGWKLGGWMDVGSFYTLRACSEFSPHWRTLWTHTCVTAALWILVTCTVQLRACHALLNV